MKLRSFLIPSALWSRFEREERGWKIDFSNALASAPLDDPSWSVGEDVVDRQIPITPALAERIARELEKDWQTRRKVTASAILRGLMIGLLRSL